MKKIILLRIKNQTQLSFHKKTKAFMMVNANSWYLSAYFNNEYLKLLTLKL